MKRACSRCGRVHAAGYECPQKPKPTTKRCKAIDRFRGSGLWKAKRTEILERDKGLCVACRLGLAGDEDLVPADSVHHIVPLAEDFELRLENDNLISLCAYHHELAERGEIAAEELRRAIE